MRARYSDKVTKLISATESLDKVRKKYLIVSIMATIRQKKVDDLS